VFCNDFESVLYLLEAGTDYCFASVETGRTLRLG
jgi:hypothetical protein